MAEVAQLWMVALIVISSALTAFFKWREQSALAAVKSDLALSQHETTRQLDGIESVAKQTHVIVNSQKTKMLQDLKASRVLALALSRSLLRQNPNDPDAKAAVELAQRLLDESVLWEGDT